MRQVFRKIPVYTGDVSGVCSALYELGGMVVMHDPSGCNSTYNTHDETRWYDRDSLIFLSGLNEVDAIMGSDEKLISDIIEAAGIYSPAFIAIANSPIPYITGIDFDAICRVIEQKTGILSFYIPTNGMHDYIHGAGLAFERAAERFLPQKAGEETKKRKDREEREDRKDLEGREDRENREDRKDLEGRADRGNREKIRCNILGVTPLDFAAPRTLDSIYEKCRDGGFDVISCWAMGRSGETDLLGKISRSTEADVNLLFSSSGYPAACYMKEKYGIPFVAGFPAEGTEEIWCGAVMDAALSGSDQFPFRDREKLSSGYGKGTRDSGHGFHDREGQLQGKAREKAEPDIPVCLIGEPVIMTSLAASIEVKSGASTRVFGATEGAGVFLGKGDAALRGEEELARALTETVEQSRYQSVKVLADPCYQDILPEGCRLVRLPHFAFSGRIFRREIPDLLRF